MRERQTHENYDNHANHNINLKNNYENHAQIQHNQRQVVRTKNNGVLYSECDRKALSQYDLKMRKVTWLILL